jgi:hypothetical protein
VDRGSLPVGAPLIAVAVVVERVAQPPQGVPGHQVGNLGADLHRERDAAVSEDAHGDARKQVERGQQRAAGPARVVNRDPADALPRAPEIKGPVDIPWLDRAPNGGQLVCAAACAARRAVGRRRICGAVDRACAEYVPKQAMSTATVQVRVCSLAVCKPFLCSRHLFPSSALFGSGAVGGWPVGVIRAGSA